ncbi:MAG: hypothetical protein LCH58_10610 [Bacteroidetes bacterium]|jgi:hypothetical protein|uniref:hypothetical protein n=1 Tax=Phnomibacter sp. TaxID=2836217 RepID=UPI002FDF079B|nr:hypothetical protein [Bacteroidota bacterium]
MTNMLSTTAIILSLLLPTTGTISLDVHKTEQKNSALIIDSLHNKQQDDCAELKNDTDLRQEIQDIANSASVKLMGCCSSYGGRENKAEIHWGKDENGICQTRISKLTNKLIITMTASWRGSLSGNYYWIKGRLVMDFETKQLNWEKISDSGGFPAGCGQRCI